MINLVLLEKLCTAYGISGDESQIRDIIKEEIKDFADSIKTDNMGNLLVFKRGRKRAAKKLLVSAHMDEVGFIVTYINENGTLKFAPVGGIIDSAAASRYVRIGKNNISGIVNAVPIHVLGDAERKKSTPVSDLQIDIGAESREQAEKYISLGDSIVFDAPFEIKDGRIISKAIDDRLGCLVLIEMIKSELPCDMYFSFVVQEEVGLRGSRAAAFTTAPDCAVIVEGTTASDVPFCENENRVCCVGKGAVVSFMDRATIYDKEYYELAMSLARENNIPVQTKTKIAGGNDAGAISVSRAGVRTAAVSVPCRYIHSASSIASVSDAQSVYDLVWLLSEKMAEPVE